jgi:hypothetical protein
MHRIATALRAVPASRFQLRASKSAKVLRLLLQTPDHVLLGFGISVHQTMHLVVGALPLLKHLFVTGIYTGPLSLAFPFRLTLLKRPGKGLGRGHTMNDRRHRGRRFQLLSVCVAIRSDKECGRHRAQANKRGGHQKSHRLPSNLQSETAIFANEC